MPKVETLKLLSNITLKTEYFTMNINTGQFERITITEHSLDMEPVMVDVIDWKDAPPWGVARNAKS